MFPDVNSETGILRASFHLKRAWPHCVFNDTPQRMRRPTSVYTSCKHTHAHLPAYTCTHTHTHTHTQCSTWIPVLPIKFPHACLGQSPSCSLTGKPPGTRHHPHIWSAPKSSLYRPWSVHPTHPLSSSSTDPTLFCLSFRGFLLQFKLISTSF